MNECVSFQIIHVILLHILLLSPFCCHCQFGPKYKCGKHICGKSVWAKKLFVANCNTENNLLAEFYGRTKSPVICFFAALLTILPPKGCQKTSFCPPKLKGTTHLELFFGAEFGTGDGMGCGTTVKALPKGIQTTGKKNIGALTHSHFPYFFWSVPFSEIEGEQHELKGKEGGWSKVVSYIPCPYTRP